MPTIAERVAVLEANHEWIKESLEDLHSKMDTHIAATPATNGGININKRTLGVAGLVIAALGSSNIIAMLEKLGITIIS